MKKVFNTTIIILALLFVIACCPRCTTGSNDENKTAIQEQQLTEVNQQGLLQTQPPPHLTWSLERENLIKRFKMMNDRSIMFYMYIFNEGVQDPIGYYQINKVSSVNSQLTNTMQIVLNDQNWHDNGYSVLPSPAEDGSYGTNGDGVFGFTPEDIYIEHNMNYICSSVPLSFTKPVNRLTVINVQTQQQLKEMMDKINVK